MPAKPKSKAKTNFGFTRVIPFNKSASPKWWIRLYFFIGSLLGLLTLLLGGIFILSNVSYNALFGYQAVGWNVTSNPQEVHSRWEYNYEQKVFTSDGVSLSIVGVLLIASHLPLLYFLCKEK